MAGSSDPLASFRLDGRVAVVTGASAGLGVVLAETLAAAGARVVLAARRVERLEALAARIEESGPRRWPWVVTCLARPMWTPWPERPWSASVAWTCW